MAIRQEIYTIYTRPYIEVGTSLKKITVYLDKGMKIYMTDPLVKQSPGGCAHKLIENSDSEDGIWFLTYSDNSLDKIRTKYKELLNIVGKDYIRIEKKVPMDAIITPLS